MKILVIGGTVFLGRHIVRAALKQGHEVTLFNRGRHNPELFPQVEKIKGDRDGGLEALTGRRWDAVVDTCGYVPRVVRASAQFLKDSVDSYVFVSTLSVYADLSVKGLNENSPVGRLEDETVEEVTGETYGPLKALCEKAVEEAFPGRAFIPRPGLIVGPHDPTDRFTYWPVRISKGGKVLAPEPKGMGVMYIDVRDLSEWMIRMMEDGKQGVYNADGPDWGTLSIQCFLETCKKVSASGAELVWVDDKFLLNKQVAPWSDLPLWLPGEETAGMSAFDVSKAFEAALAARPLEETVRDTVAWHKSLENQELKAGISREREGSIIDAWLQKERG